MGTGGAMKKLKRSSRIVDMTRILLENPHRIIPLTTFSEQYGSAKSSISEDLDIIKEVLEEEGIGELVTLTGAAGGVKYVPKMKRLHAESFMRSLIEELSDPNRILSGGYIYMTDILGDPKKLVMIAKLFATYFADAQIDYVMTVETQGIPLAYAVANQFTVPVIIVRRNSNVTEGSVVTINYLSGSSKRIQMMSLGRRSLPLNSRVLIVDDFMKAGGTIRGMYDLLHEFDAQVVGAGVLVEHTDADERLVDEYVSLARLTNIDARKRLIELELGNYFDK